MRKLVAALVVTFLVTAAFVVSAVDAAGPEDDVAGAGQTLQRALTAAQVGDLVTAQREYKSYENRWFDIEDGVRGKSRDSYRVIEKQMSLVDMALSQSKPDKAQVVTALTALDTELKRFVAGQPPLDAAVPTTSTQPVATGESSITNALGLLESTRQAVAAGDFETATAHFEAFSNMWLDVEGEVKTRSASDYRRIENDMARVSTALSKSSASDATPVLGELHDRLSLYEASGNYRVYDATIILLREGLEALLVVVALLAFVKKSGNEDKGSWVWLGAGGGLVASIVLGVAIHVIFGKAFSGSNREMMEGFTGIGAAVMLLYVSYWLHSKSSLGAWQRYISQNTTRALAKGSLVGIALLSFLTVFREGGETVLFLLGMTGKIAVGDLLLGLAIGAAFLTVLGVLLIVAGLRIPMRPFFAVASVLTFYLCFKFLGTGIHALQIADIFPARTADYLPSNETLGLFPTWQTTIPQLVLLFAGLAVAVKGRLADRAIGRQPSVKTAVTS